LSRPNSKKHSGNKIEIKIEITYAFSNRIPVWEPGRSVDRKIPFKYEVPLFAPDGSFYIPDFTITWRGEQWYWEHLGLLDREDYKNHWQVKKQWYEKHFPDRLITTVESPTLSKDVEAIVDKYFS